MLSIAPTVEYTFYLTVSPTTLFLNTTYLHFGRPIARPRPHCYVDPVLILVDQRISSHGAASHSYTDANRRVGSPSSPSALSSSQGEAPEGSCRGTLVADPPLLSFSSSHFYLLPMICAFLQGHVALLCCMPCGALPCGTPECVSLCGAASHTVLDGREAAHILRCSPVPFETSLVSPASR